MTEKEKNEAEENGKDTRKQNNIEGRREWENKGRIGEEEGWDEEDGGRGGQWREENLEVADKEEREKKETRGKGEEKIGGKEEEKENEKMN
jgi:hypothetical protein